METAFFFFPVLFFGGSRSFDISVSFEQDPILFYVEIFLCVRGVFDVFCLHACEVFRGYEAYIFQPVF